MPEMLQLLNGINQIYSDVFRSVDMITARKALST